MPFLHCISSFEGTLLLFLLVFTSADIFFQKYLEFHSTLSEKKIFVTNFPILMGSLKPPPHPVNTQNPLTYTFL